MALGSSTETFGGADPGWIGVLESLTPTDVEEKSAIDELGEKSGMLVTGFSAVNRVIRMGLVIRLELQWVLRQ